MQLRGIDKKIASLKAELNYASRSDHQHFMNGLAVLEEEKARLAQGIAGCTLVDASDSDHVDGAMQSSPRALREKDESSQTPPPLTSGVGCSDNDGEQSERESVGDYDADTRRADEHRASGIVITERELRQQFHLPLHTAAQRFGICTTAFKKLCRRFKIAKWPHRQLRGIDKKIAALKAELNYATGDRESCSRSLSALQEAKLRISRPPARAAASSPGKGESEGTEDTLGKCDVAYDKCASGGAHTRASLYEGLDQVKAAVVDSLRRSCHGGDGGDGVSPLDLLATVAGMKELHDRALTTQQQDATGTVPVHEPVIESEAEAASRAKSLCSVLSTGRRQAIDRSEEFEQTIRIDELIWGSEEENGISLGLTKLAPLAFPTESLDTPPLQPLPPMTPPMHFVQGTSAVPSMC